MRNVFSHLASVASLLVALLTAVCCPVQAHDKLGANLDFISDFSRSQEFNDVLKHSRGFLRVGTFDALPANLAPVGSDGWPTGDFSVIAMAAQQDTLNLGGTYKIIFNGQATVALSGGSAGSLSNRTFDAATNTTRVDLVFPNGGQNMFLNFTQNNQLKNLRILRPGVAESNPTLLSTGFKSHVERFKTVRFLDWTRTNGNRHVAWADRTTPEKLRTEALIAQWETVIDAANELNSDPWINVPVQANDEYVTNLATLFRDRLKPNLNVYVEYGNELWNFNLRDNTMDALLGGAFNGATVNRNLAVAEAAAAGSPLRFDGSTNPSTQGQRRVGVRLAQISAIWSGVWGAGAINTRVRMVLAGQMATPSIVNEAIRAVDEGMNIRPNTVFYALSGAPYIFGSANNDSNADEVAGLTVDQLIAGMTAGIANASSQSSYNYLTHAGLGAWYGLKVVAYEGGFDNFGASNISVKRQANLDPRMLTMCRNLIDGWHASGFDLFMYFHAGAGSYNTQFGMWPIVEDIATPNTPKNQCMNDILAAPLPAVTLGTPILPNEIAAGAFTGSANANGTLTGLASQFGFPGYVEYLLRVDTAGTYNIALRGNSPGESFRVLLNNTTLTNTLLLPNATGISTLRDISLRKGLNVLRIARTSGASWTLNSLQFSLVSAAPEPTPDTSPDPFSFTPLVNVSTNTLITSSSVTITGINTPTVIGVSNGSYSIGCTSNFTNAVGTISNRQAVCIRHTSAAVGNATITTALTIGNITGAFSSTTTAAAERFNVSVSVVGSGAVVSNPAGINCGSLCIATFDQGTVLTLTAQAGVGTGFGGWGGACSGTAPTCNITLNNVANVSARFCNTAPTADCDGDGIPNNVEPQEGRNISVKDNDVFSVPRLFVMQQFRDFLEREGDTGGLAFWTGEIAAGRQTRASMAEAFLASPEYANLIAPMTRLYFGSFVRIPDYEGLRFWVREFASGQRSAASIASLFASSPEFLSTYGTLDNRAFIERLYINILNRSTASDPAGQAFWQGELDSGRRTRGDVLLAFTESAEYKSVRANQLNVVAINYALSQRSPTTQEFNTDAAALAAGTVTLRSLVQRTIDSPAYRQRFLP